MKLYSKLALILYFGITILLISIGALSEFVKEYYPIVKETITSFISKQFGSLPVGSDNRYGGISAV